MDIIAQRLHRIYSNITTEVVENLEIVREHQLTFALKLKEGCIDNWSDHFATAELPPSWFPVKYPYPRAHYADVAGFVHLRNLIMPLPSLREPTPPVSS